YVDLLDDWRLRQKLGRFGHQRRRNFSREMRLPAGVVGKSVEDAEGGRPHADGKPRDRSRLLLHDGQASAKKAFYIAFFTGVRIQTHVQTDFQHACFPSVKKFARRDRMPPSDSRGIRDPGTGWTKSCGAGAALLSLTCSRTVREASRAGARPWEDR